MACDGEQGRCHGAGTPLQAPASRVRNRLRARVAPMPSLVDPGRVAVVSTEVAFETMVRKPADADDADVRSALSRRGFIRRVALLGGGVIGVAAPGLAAEHGESGAPPTARGMALDVRQFGARGDGESDDTAAIQRTIDAAAGGTVVLPPGTWRSGTLRLRSAMRL